MDQRLTEPAGGGPVDWRGLCEELADALACHYPGHVDDDELVNRARAALARWGRPAPVPAEGEVAELGALLRAEASDDEIEDHLLWMTSADARRAAALLEQRHPAPVPVSERLPGDALCWWFEADEDCGYGSTWTLLRIRGSATGATHWLPAHALPLPAGEGEK